MASVVETPIKIPQPLAFWQVAGYTAMFTVCLTAFVTACVGLWVLTDNEQATWLGQTTFAEKYRQVMQWNQMTSALCFNGGALGTVVSFAQLRRHRQARLLKNVRFLHPSDINKARKAEKKRR